MSPSLHRLSRTPNHLHGPRPPSKKPLLPHHWDSSSSTLPVDPPLTSLLSGAPPRRALEMPTARLVAVVDEVVVAGAAGGPISRIDWMEYRR